MTTVRWKRILGYLVSAAGLGMVIVAVWAHRLGIEHDAQWGPARRFLLGAGIFTAVAPYLRGLLGLPLRTLERALDRAILRLRRDEAVSSAEARRSRVSGGVDFACTVVVPFLLAVAALTWIISAGRWTDWPGTTSYFHLLAEGFRAGKTHLLVEPHPDLLALEDPYPYENRAEIPHLWDVSLFQGKYYLYWGPTPALTALVLEPLLPGELGDHHLAWLFTAGSIFWVLLLLWRLRQSFFPDAPLWSGALIAFGAAWATPFPWLVSRPEVYEAAIAGGQFYFLAGLYGLLMVQFRPGSQGARLAVAGICWSLAVGSRITLAPVVTVLSLTYAMHKIRHEVKEGTWRRGLQSVMPLLLVLALGALLLGWYNYDRFGSIWELGHRYQLGRGDEATRYKNMISFSNVPLNSYNYLLNPVKRISVFPFVKPEWGKYAIPFLRLAAPTVYHTEKVVGLLFSTPLVLLGAVPLLHWLWRFWQELDSSRGRGASSSPPLHNGELSSIYLFLELAALMEMGPLLLFTASTERHLMDLTPTLLLLSGIGLWHALRVWRGMPARRLFLTSFVLLLSLHTAVMGILLAVTGYGGRFEAHNPELFERLTRFFAW